MHMRVLEQTAHKPNFLQGGHVKMANPGSMHVAKELRPRITLHGI